MQVVDKVIFGAGIYGLYYALECVKRNQTIVVLEYENEIFSRASSLNQSRVHNGYHYPRSYATAIKSAKYFDRFVSDFDFCINKNYKNIYAASDSFSSTNLKQFKQFCNALNIKCDEVDYSFYLNKGIIEGAFETNEFSFDFNLLKQYFLNELIKYKNCNIIYNSRTLSINQENGKYIIELESSVKVETEFILNATYGSLNQILALTGFELFDIKYELCEIILCKASDKVKDIGITLMDGQFFSLIPFGNTGFHSLSSVQYTPHKISNESLPGFNCQVGVECSPMQLQNCNNCINKPKSNWIFMKQQTKKYLNSNIELNYVQSLFSIKAILKSAEIDDSRPTVIKEFSKSPYFYSVLSGKINSIYDLDEILF